MKASATGSPKSRWRNIVIAAVVLIGVYGIVPQLGVFKHSLHVVRMADVTLALVAFGSALLSYIAAAGCYVSLAYPRLRLRRSIIVELASMFINRLLPGGVGGLGTNYLYLRKSKATAVQAGSIVAINNLLGLVGHALLLGAGLLLFPHQTVHIHDSLKLNKTVSFFIVILVVVILCIAGYALRNKIQRWLQQFAKQLQLYRSKPYLLLLALLSSMLITATTVGALWICVLALHMSLSPLSVLVIFSFGIALGTATPTPGGLGGFEAGLVAGFVAYHVASAQALAVVLVYRLISFWLPLVIGGVAFVYSRRQKYI